MASVNEGSGVAHASLWKRIGLSVKLFIERIKFLMGRFALPKFGIGLVAIVAVLVGTWVVWRGTQGYRGDQGLLGRPLRVGIVSWPGYAGGLVANNGLRASKDSDFWRRHLLVEFVLEEDEKEMFRKFLRGGENDGVDVMWSTVDSLAQSLVQQAPALEKAGIEPRAFLQVDWSRGADAFIARSGIDRIEDLRGKRVAVSRAASQWLFEYSLENSSLTDNEKTKIRQSRNLTSGSEDARKQFVAKKVEAAVLWEPDVSDALNHQKGKILVDTAAADKLIADVMVTNEKFITQHPDVITAFIEGWLIDGTPKAISDPMLAVRTLQAEEKFKKLGDDITHDLLAKTALATLYDNVEMFGLAGGHPFFDDLFKQASRTWVKAGYMVGEVKADRARDSANLEDVYQTYRSSVEEKDCQEFKTDILTIPFPPGTAELIPKAQRALNDDVVSFLLRSHSAVRFCVEASTAPGDDAQRASKVLQEREEAIIRYLEEHCKRPRSQFISTSGDAHETDSGEKITRYIRLKVVSPDE
jgi:ABC-type amino acid transport substrate-binding protein